MRKIKNNCIKIPSNLQCEECYASVFSDESYVFPCLHAFHKNCLLKKLRDPIKK